MNLGARDRNGGYIGTELVFPTNKGASFGPRVVTCGFTASVDHPTYRRGDARLTIDIDGADWQDDSTVRRKCARVAVSFAARAARAIRAGGGEPVAEFQPGSTTWAHVVFFLLEQTEEGWDRSARVGFDFPFSDEDGEPQVGVTDAEWAATGIERLGKRLHGAIDDVVNAPVFGWIAG